MLNLDLCFMSLHWTFSWPNVSCHTLQSLSSSSVPVGRMERVPWQPAVPNGLCLSALRITVGKRASLALPTAAVPLTEREQSYRKAESCWMLSWRSKLISSIYNAGKYSDLLWHCSETLEVRQKKLALMETSLERFNFFSFVTVDNVDNCRLKKKTD